jgi:ssRNA-specific RNase YbeY (16S rRNA maturation enzyme)
MHAIGHDDHEPEAHTLMHAEEDRLLTRIGVGAIFRSPSSQGDSQ